MYFRMSAGQLQALFTDAGVSSEKTVQQTTGRRFEPEHRGGVGCCCWVIDVTSSCRDWLMCLFAVEKFGTIVGFNLHMCNYLHVKEKETSGA